MSHHDRRDAHLLARQPARRRAEHRPHLEQAHVAMPLREVVLDAPAEGLEELAAEIALILGHRIRELHV
jgi:hypothetical protein